MNTNRKSLSSAEDIDRIFEIPYYQLNHYPQEILFSYKENGSWHHTSTKNFIEESNKLSRALLEMGIGKSDKVAVISSMNHTPWHIVDMGVSQVGAYLVPIYANMCDEDYQYIINHAEVSYCFISDKEIFNKIDNIRDNIPSLKEIYSFRKIENCRHWDEVLELGSKATNQKQLDEVKQSINTDDVATIIYTSGTTGNPKGVMLTHRNIISNVLDCRERLSIGEYSVALSFLPVSHVYERMIIYLYIYSGLSIYFAESLDKIGANMLEVRPHIITAVPRLLEKIFDKISIKGSKLRGIKRKIFFWSLNVGVAYTSPDKKKNLLYEIKLKIARKLVFSKWKIAFGGRLTIIVSGSATLQEKLSKIFMASGIILLEGYGLTETSPVVSVGDSNTGQIRQGKVGKPLRSVEVKIAEDGEILCKGPNVMKGYYKNQKLTDSVIIDGYFHTGDIGFLDKDNYLEITDRKKEIFKTSGGKYIRPQVIESKMRQSPFIEQIMVIGEGEKMPAAFVQPNFEYLIGWAAHKGIEGDVSQLIKNLEVINRFKKELDFYNKDFGKWEQIKKFTLTSREWSIEKGELTSTTKLRRKQILDTHKELYKKIYLST